LAGSIGEQGIQVLAAACLALTASDLSKDTQRELAA
jgi:hypothetical protein